MNQNYLQELGEWAQSFSSKPGIDRDNPIGKIEAHIDGQWMRFDNGNARKMGGYTSIVPGTTDIIRALFTVSLQDFTRLFIFRNTGVWQVDILADGSVTSETNRTPTDWVNPDVGTPDLTFSIDQMTIEVEDVEDETTYIFFTAPPNSQQINQTVEAPIYGGPINAITPFVDIGQKTSGGVIVYLPYLIKYGNNGTIFYSKAKNPFDWTENNQKGVSAQKLLAMHSFPGGMLAWTSSTLYRGSYDTTINEFVFTPAATQISLLSPSSIVPGHNSTFYWVGKNQFYIYNGVSDTIDNPFNRNQFFEKINKTYAGKVFGLYVGDFKEIWWFSPQGNATECNHLYNFPYKSGHWSDSVCWRSAGVGETILDKPLLADAQLNIYSGIPTYSIWMHEVGYDIVDNGISYPLPCWIQTKQFSMVGSNPQINVEMRIRKIEKDLQQIGDVTVQAFTYTYMDSVPYVQNEFTFTPSTTQIDIDLSGRYISLKYTSNTIGGFFQLGKINYDYKLGAVRPGGTN